MTGAMALQRPWMRRVDLQENVPAAGGIEEETETDVSDAPIVQLVRSLIEQAIRQRASDIHIEALQEKVRVRYRIDGALYEKMVYDNSLLRLFPPVSRLWAVWISLRREKASGWPYDDYGGQTGV